MLLKHSHTLSHNAFERALCFAGILAACGELWTTALVPSERAAAAGRYDRQDSAEIRGFSAVPQKLHARVEPQASRTLFSTALWTTPARGCRLSARCGQPDFAIPPIQARLGVSDHVLGPRCTPRCST
jgi:hypothetical protein